MSFDPNRMLIVCLGAQVQAAAPPTLPLKEPEVSAVSSTTPHRTLESQKPTSLEVVNGRSNVVVANDLRFVNGNQLKPSEINNESQKQLKPKTDDLTTHAIYEGPLVMNNINYHRLSANENSSIKSIERRNDREANEQRRELPKNCFTPPSLAVTVKSYPKDETPHSNGVVQYVPEEIKMEVDEPSKAQDDSLRFEQKRSVDKERFREESPGKEAVDRGVKDPHYDHVNGADGSVRSDEGYHSHGYHDEALTPPEDSSDSDDSDNNYVLDFRLVNIFKDVS